MDTTQRGQPLCSPLNQVAQELLSREPSSSSTVLGSADSFTNSSGRKLAFSEPRSPSRALKAAGDNGLGAGATTTFRIRDRVMVKRSSGEYTLGTVFNYDDSSRLYTICLNGDLNAANDPNASQQLAFKRVPERDLKPVEPPKPVKPPSVFGRSNTSAFGSLRMNFAKAREATPSLSLSTAKVSPEPLPGQALLVPDEKKALRRVARLLTRARTTCVATFDKVAPNGIFTVSSFKHRIAPAPDEDPDRAAILRRLQRGSCPAIVVSRMQSMVAESNADASAPS